MNNFANDPEGFVAEVITPVLTALELDPSSGSLPTRVATDLLRSQLGAPLRGLANQIVDRLRGGNGCRPLQDGRAAAERAAAGKLVNWAWQAEDRDRLCYAEHDI
jgi:hypothetical protein